jgi:hypothetical protein
MSQSDGYPEGTAANLNIAGTHRPLVSRRRIEHLKQLAYDCNLTNEQAREYGKLSVTATWEKLLTAHGLEFDRKIEPTGSTTAPTTQINSINFFEWVSLSQLIAITLASAGVILLLMNLWPRALNVIPRPVHFKIEFSISGDK